MAQLRSNMTINVSCVTPFICVTFKTTSQRNIRKKVAFIIEPFRSLPVIRRYCSADFKILVLSFTFAAQKSTKKTPKKEANSSSCQHSDTHMGIIHLIYLYLGLRNIQTRSLHSVVRCYLAVNATLIVNMKSNSEETAKSVCYESDKI